jgi:hypothetical protein
MRRQNKAIRGVRRTRQLGAGSLDKLEMLRFSTKSKIWENFAKAIRGVEGQGN